MSGTEARRRFGAMARTTALALAAFGIAGAAHAVAQTAGAQAGDGMRLRPVRARHASGAAARPLTVRVRPNRPFPLEARREPTPPVDDFVFRDWNDTRVRTLYGFRLGGNVFYGDGRGDPINYGNATLAGISGYGGARGGFGGPHFDSVGGFHPGPGPDYKESLDYASGRIWTPDYDVPTPKYPGVAARVAALNAGIVPGDDRVGEARTRAGARLTPTRLVPPAARLPLRTPPADDDEAQGGRPATADDVFSGFDFDGL